MKSKLPFLVLSFVLLVQILFTSPKAQAENNPATNMDTKSVQQPQSISHTITVTAKVPLSNLWSDAIKKNSTAGVISQSEVGKQTLVSLQLAGLDNKILPHENVSAVFTKDGKTLLTEDGLTDDDGSTAFGFVPKQPGTYTVQFFYHSWDQTILLNPQIQLHY